MNPLTKHLCLTHAFSHSLQTFDLMRNHGINPNELTLQVLFKAFGVLAVSAAPCIFISACSSRE